MKKISKKLIVLSFLLIVFSFYPSAVFAHCLDGDSPCPVANYPFREGTGNYTDAIHAKTGSVVSGLRSQLYNVNWTSGATLETFDPYSGNFALSFNGQNSYVQMPSNSVFNLKDKLTLKFRLKLRSMPAAESIDIVGKRPSYWFEIYKGGDCAFWITREGEESQAIFAWGGCLISYDLNHWVEFKLTYDGTKAQLFKLGGGIGGYKTFSSSKSLVQTTTPLTLGAEKFITGSDGKAYGGSFNGDLDYVEVYHAPFNPLKGDLNYDDVVDYQDMQVLLKSCWYQDPSVPPFEIVGDFDKNNNVDSRDFAILSGLIKWNITSPR